MGVFAAADAKHELQEWDCEEGGVSGAADEAQEGGTAPQTRKQVAMVFVLVLVVLVMLLEGVPRVDTWTTLVMALAATTAGALMVNIICCGRGGAHEAEGSVSYEGDAGSVCSAELWELQIRAGHAQHIKPYKWYSCMRLKSCDMSPPKRHCVGSVIVPKVDEMLWKTAVGSSEICEGDKVKASKLTNNPDFAIFRDLYFRAWDAKERGKIVSIKQLSGASGALVLKVESVERGFTLQSVLKLGSKSSVRQELKNTKAAGQYFPMLQEMGWACGGDRGGVRFRFATMNGNSCMLGDLFNNFADNEASINQTLSMLTSYMCKGSEWFPCQGMPDVPAFARVTCARSSISSMPFMGPEKKVLLDIDFSSHVKKSKPCLEALFGETIESLFLKDELIFRGQPYPNPLRRFYHQEHGVLTTHRDVLCNILRTGGTHWGRVHGDLHVSNVLVDRIGEQIGSVFMIDFEKYGVGHVAHDLCRLEASILLWCTEMDLNSESDWFAEACSLMEKLARGCGDMQFNSFDVSESEQSRQEECNNTSQFTGDSWSSITLKLAHRVILRLRRKWVGFCGSLTATEYQVCLLNHVFMMSRYEQVKSEAHRHLGYAYSGYLAKLLKETVVRHTPQICQCDMDAENGDQTQYLEVMCSTPVGKLF